jgi:segregation and condensation protein B
VPGRPELLGTSREFLDYFGLKSLDDLPTLAELQDLEDINVQLELPGAPVVVEPLAAAEFDDTLDDEAAADDEDEDRPQPDATTLVASPPDDSER